MTDLLKLEALFKVSQLVQKTLNIFTQLKKKTLTGLRVKKKFGSSIVVMAAQCCGYD